MFLLVHQKKRRGAGLEKDIQWLPTFLQMFLLVLKKGSKGAGLERDSQRPLLNQNWSHKMKKETRNLSYRLDHVHRGGQEFRRAKKM